MPAPRPLPGPRRRVVSAVVVVVEVRAVDLGDEVVVVALLANVRGVGEGCVATGAVGPVGRCPLPARPPVAPSPPR